MKTLEKMEKFQLENENLVTVTGGKYAVGDPGIKQTGGGTCIEADYPSKGYNTYVTYTSDTEIEGGGPGRTQYHNATYDTVKA